MKRFLLVFVILLSMGKPFNALAWNEDTTHVDLTSAAVRNSQAADGTGSFVSNYLGIDTGILTFIDWGGGLGGTKDQIINWFKKGARDEDKGDRSLYHFHDPYYTNPWTGAGLSLPTSPGSPEESALVWAKDSVSQQNNSIGDWSWTSSRSHYLNALTYQLKTDRDSALVQTFIGLGHLVHLVQDMAQPDHVRNDPHPLDASEQWLGLRFRVGIESWAQVNRTTTSIYIFTSPPVRPTFSPSTTPSFSMSSYWDTDQYNGTLKVPPGSQSTNFGLSEFTQTNYFSDDTIYSNIPDDLFFPTRDFTNYALCNGTYTIGPFTLNRPYWGRKACDTNGKPQDYFIANSLLNFGVVNPSNAVLDDNVYNQYASELLPYAVGYSAEFINYFFRGQIKLFPPNTGVYAITSPWSTSGFGSTPSSYFRVNAQNVTLTGEEMTGGTVQLVIRYRTYPGTTYITSPEPSVPPLYQNYDYSTMDYQYIVVPLYASSNQGIGTTTSIPTTSPVELTFDLSGSPLPFNATDVTIQVVYHGPLGNETDAVAVGYKDISEPTPLDFTNDLDKVCLSGDSTYPTATLVNATTPSDNTALNWANTYASQVSMDVYAHTMKDIFIKFAPLSATSVSVSSADYNVYISTILPGQYARVYVLGDPMPPNDSYGFKFSMIDTIEAYDSRDKFTHGSEFLNGSSSYGLPFQTYPAASEVIIPLIGTFRTLSFWDLVYSDPWQFSPPNTTPLSCSYSYLAAITPNQYGPVNIFVIQ